MKKKFLICLFFLFFNFFLSAQNRLKILFVVGGFPDITETFILNQITALLDRGYDVYIYADGKGKNEKVHTDIEKYNLLERTFYLMPEHLAPFDVVCCQFGFLARKVLHKKNNLGNNVIICFRGTDITEYVRRKPKVYSRLFKYAHRYQKNILCLPVCNFFAKLLWAMGAPRDRVVVHPSAIDCNNLAYKERQYKKGDPIKLLCVARLVDKKGHEDLLHALTIVIKKYPDVHLTLAGDGPKKRKIESLIQELGLQEHVTLFGWADKDEVKELFQDAHIFVLASKTDGSGNMEGIPNVLKEAMSSGVPVVSTRHSGITDLITHTQTGMLAKEGDYQELAEHIIYLIEHPEQWNEMTKKARAFVEDGYHIENVIDRFERLVYQLIG